MNQPQLTLPFVLTTDEPDEPIECEVGKPNPYAVIEPDEPEDREPYLDETDLF